MIYKYFSTYISLNGFNGKEEIGLQEFLTVCPFNMNASKHVKDGVKDICVKNSVKIG